MMLDKHREKLNSIKDLKAELSRCEAELEYQVSHKRIAALQQRISEIETEIENIIKKDADFFMSVYREGGRVYENVLQCRYGEYTKMATDYILEKGYVRMDTDCICPRCRKATALRSELYGTSIFCKFCGKEIPTFLFETSRTKPVLIRTWGGKE